MNTGERRELVSGFFYSLHRRRRFGLDSPLRDYLQAKRPHSPAVTDSTTNLNNVLSLVYEIIAKENLADPTNPRIVIADEDLERALNVKAFHGKDLPHFVVGQLYVTPVPPVVRSEGNHPSKDSEFRVKPRLWEFLVMVRGLNPTNEIFTLGEIKDHLSDYICENLGTLTDSRNYSVLFCEGTPLERLFGSKTFHREQMISFIYSQIEPHVVVMNNLDDDTSDNSLSNDNHGGISESEICSSQTSDGEDSEVVR